jgi:hypothetical protein
MIVMSQFDRGHSLIESNSSSDVAGQKKKKRRTGTSMEMMNFNGQQLVHSDDPDTRHRCLQQLLRPVNVRG